MERLFAIPALILAATLVAGCEMEPDPEPTGTVGVAGHGEVGAVDFQVSCDPEVREDFDHALALVHHMMYGEARSTFEAVADRDPDCAMAHWGVAKTLFQPLWPSRPDEDAVQEARERVAAARELGPGDDREIALLDAVEAFWAVSEEDGYWARVEAWEAAMAEAHEAHPDDLDIAAFRGLSLLAMGQTTDEQVAWNARAAELLADVLANESLHPGAIHYTIHADDVTGRASENLAVVDRYSEIAPRTPHALHMPSHIHVRLGNWPEVIEWNRASADAALHHPVGETTSFHFIHALDYKLYGYLQRGDDEQARAVLAEAMEHQPYQEDFNSAFHLAIMPARLAVERRDWEAAAELEPRQPAGMEWDRYLWPEALSWYALGLGHVHTGDVDTAREAEARMAELVEAAREDGEEGFATYIEVDRLILEGRIAAAEGDTETAIERMREAADLEDTVEKHPITPGALLPPREALGELLLELDRPEEALQAFQAGLDVWPGRYHSLAGAIQAADEAGLEEEAEALRAALRDVVDEGATDRPEVDAVAG